MLIFYVFFFSNLCYNLPEIKQCHRSNWLILSIISFQHPSYSDSPSKSLPDNRSSSPIPELPGENGKYYTTMIDRCICTPWLPVVYDF
jgi:hypothetical protein